MNYYTLKKKTTREKMIPVHGKGTCFHEGNEDSIQYRIPLGDKEEGELWETVCEFWPTEPASRARNDARMFAHCINNFDKALESLKRGVLQEQHEGITTPWGLRTAELIKELEEVLT